MKTVRRPTKTGKTNMFSGIAKKSLVAGFDDIPSIYKYSIPLITVSHDKKCLAEAAVEYILNKSSDEDEYISYSITDKSAPCR